ncbi:6-phosphogluconolactonase [Fulvimonas soli]|uniref:6-phosphogluconolactonase n=1 Tax=Fulvimonas soli TaxID=155197 RepID=A0A316IPK5_9GAMM|nr:6-phosphogluconolactonase [Fulvimonas soli]PWK92458.1 6-phosphogluconolactonase [Fulvimonas soli]TNY25448.1 6-phosphogluconolactonase [Fulvimonas soli]
MPDPRIAMYSFDDGPALAAALAGRVAGLLREGIAARGAAVLAVSGGSTPVRFFERLARQALAWDKVRVTLVDERWVDEDSERSNARLVKAQLLQGAAAAARFVPLYTGADTPEAGCAEARQRIRALPRPFDAVVLGMGADGHTASFFPGGDRLVEALDPDGRVPVLPMRAAGAGEPRITLALPALLDTRALILHIEGAPKRALLAAALEGRGEAAQYPVRAVLTQRRVPLEVYWCP